MAYKETNPDGCDIGRNGGTKLPKITMLERDGAIVDIECFTDKALESIGKAITHGLIRDARALRIGGE